MDKKLCFRVLLGYIDLFSEGAFIRSDSGVKRNLIQEKKTLTQALLLKFLNTGPKKCEIVIQREEHAQKTADAVLAAVAIKCDEFTGAGSVCRYDGPI